MGETTPDDGEFVRATEGFRRELLAHCYRLLGSVDDAEDLVQETYLRAWRGYEGFEGRSSVRVWLYRIATNVCLTALGHRNRRVLPSGLGRPVDDPSVPPIIAGPEVRWLQPMPDALVRPESDDPAAAVAVRDSIRLALMACLQYLPARQRAVLILRDVLAFSATEVADMLDTTTAAVKSTLRRARAKVEEISPAAERVVPPTDRELRALLARYITAFENSDAAALESLLRQDATLEMTPAKTWFSGKATCVPYLTKYALFSPGDWRMVPTSANGQPAVVAYLRGEDGAHHAFAIAVLTLAVDGIARITLFGEPGMAAKFGRPQVRPVPDR
ncbi:RNA polymerase subunit sigma-70 [Amycolatopsis sp. WAC 01375]|uniref:sigma-70 family RNA polymerase sigma factor n=1 Tax=Amycolatopsis sp. WAC 01375 TaxID=2203194 RepID=UPI000F7695DA|nr:sigma-70 family RNA polymerase sigma factor [Amycolatopsis sp. WAC 01375]RSM73357.1 RNA polymerase subunit sigma-70 [Amycolatopsis sp. WAC 01375]